MKAMEELIGHITSNPNKIKVLEVLNKKNSDVKALSKATRIPPKMLERIIKELKADGVIEEKNGQLRITEKGFKAITSLRGVRM
ncbi:MAG: hypothetical protein DRO98_07410 [Archaeoglobales archaeon]|nr:MAG: hypothetical protein DRO98_07410 [Archaeoglobales archaeon]